MFVATQPFDRANSKRHKLDRDALHTLTLPKREEENTERSIAIRLADCDGQRSSASMLVNRKYVQRGYGTNHKVPTAPNCVTFTASSQDRIIGTLSLTDDSPAGLALDRTFKDELDEFRKQPGLQICELTKFAVDSDESSLKLLASLFHIIFIYGTTKFGTTDTFIEVNPRHVRFYQSMLSFQRVGTVKTNAAVGAPSVLLWLKSSDMRRHIDEQVGKSAGKSHSLYPYFFSNKEERGIFARLMEMEGGSLTKSFERLPSPSSSAPH